MRVQNGYCADFERSSQPAVLLLAARGPARKQWHLNFGAQQLLLESVRRKVATAARGGLTSAKRVWVGFGRPDLGVLAVQYRALAPAAKNMLKESGRGATAAGRSGHSRRSAFGCTGKYVRAEGKKRARLALRD